MFARIVSAFFSDCSFNMSFKLFIATITFSIEIFVLANADETFCEISSETLSHFSSKFDFTSLISLIIFAIFILKSSK